MTFPVRVPARPDVRRWAGAAALAAVCSLSLAACGDDPEPVSDETSEPTAGGSSEPAPTASPSEPTDSPTASPSESPSGTTVPVYYAGDGPGGTVLFREFRRVEGDPLLEAARLVAGGTPDDPDYRTLWPQVEITSVQATDGVLLVTVPSDAFTAAPDGMSERDARLALQQLVYTLQGVQQERVPVQVQREGGAPLFGLPTEAPYEAADPLQTLNLVSITSPAEGDTVTGDSLTVTGVSSSFEASGPCRILRGDVVLVDGGYQAEGWLDRLYPFEAQLPLDGVTGEVTLQCETDDPSGGTEGNGPAVDTKTITIAG
ncbi:GerMN domain-containing protein [Nocardioides sp. J2M5]|uniref:Gmad2 immunoglobulin-like domain-containing protein n=1 Tax=Nocardioides palaemonis TaxID=2829810 RepID=UPI001BA9F9BC|nr:Gmad2 immunoglobulin-like domain-containing protein [Nocardioides palaemonis]MBS2938649.1 GerMN domain-containing protein [Nocardioides palaemonis]